MGRFKGKSAGAHHHRKRRQRELDQAYPAMGGEVVEADFADVESIEDFLATRPATPTARQVEGLFGQVLPFLRRIALGAMVEHIIKGLGADEHVVVVVTRRGPDCGCEDCRARWTDTGKPRLRVLASITDDAELNRTEGNTTDA